MSKKPITNKGGDVRELTKAEMRALKPIQEADPEMAKAMIAMKAKRGRGRPKLQAPREMLSLRLKSKIVAEIKSGGKGYNTRIERLLEKALESGIL